MDIKYIIDNNDNSLTNQFVNGGLSATSISADTYYNLPTFTGNTSGDCIIDLYVSNVNSCSPLHIQPLNTGDVYIGENGGVNVGIGTSSPSRVLDSRGTFNLQPSTNTFLRFDGTIMEAQVGSSNNQLTLNRDNFGITDLKGSGGVIVSNPTYSNSLSIGTNTILRENDKIVFSSSDNFVRGWWDIQNSKFRVGGGGYSPVYSSTTETFEVVGTSKVTGNVGIGITGSTDSTSRLQIKGSDSSSSNYGLKVQNSGGTDNLVVRNDGNIGINTSNPNYQLEVLPKDLTGTTNVVIRNTSTSPNWAPVGLSVINGSNHGVGMSTSSNGVDTQLNINSGIYSQLTHSVNGTSVAELGTAGDYLLWRLPNTFDFRKRSNNYTWLRFDSLNQNLSIFNETGSPPSINSKLGVRGSDSSSSNYGLKVQDSGGTDNLVVRNDGLITVNDVTNGSDSSNTVRFYQTIPTTGTYNYGFYSSGAPNVANFGAVGNTSRTHFYSSESQKTAYEADMAATVSSPFRVGFNASIVGTNTGGTNVALYSDVRNGVSNYTIYSVNGDSFFNKTSMLLNGKTNGTDPILSLNNLTGTTLFYVRNDGNVGVGTSTPNAKLHINNITTGNTVLFEDDTSPDPSPFVIDNGGKVGVGTTTPSEKLEVNNGFIKTNQGVIVDGGTFYGLRFNGSGNSRFAIDNSYKLNAAFTEGFKFTNGVYDFFNYDQSGFGDTFQIGNGLIKGRTTGTTDVYLGINVLGTPSSTLEVNGKTKTTTLQVTSGSPQVGYVLTATDTDGNMSWDSLVDSFYVEPSSTAVTWNVSGNSSNYKLTLTANTTLNLNNVRNGDYGTIILTQDSGGNKTVTLGTVNGAAATHKVVNGGAGLVSLTTTANAIDILSFTYDGTNMYWNKGLNYT
jgi:hypothetical protein